MIRTFVLATAATLAVAHPAVAQPAPPQQPDPAETAYQEGKRLYDVQDWDGAIAKFREAYRIRPDKAPLFNIAQAFRLKGDCQQAITAYKTYKRNYPDAENIAKVEKFIADLEATCKPGTTPPTGTGGTTGTTGVVGTTGGTGTGTGTTGTGTGTGTTGSTGGTTGGTTGTGTGAAGGTAGGVGTSTSGAASVVGNGAADEDPGKTKRYVGYGLIGVGGLGIVTGVALAVVARGKANDVSKGGGTWDPSVEAAGERAARNARIALIVGALAVGGGITLVMLGRSDSGEVQRVSLIPTDEGGLVSWSGHF